MEGYQRSRNRKGKGAKARSRDKFRAKCNEYIDAQLQEGFRRWRDDIGLPLQSVVDKLKFKSRDTIQIENVKVKPVYPDFDSDFPELYYPLPPMCYEESFETGDLNMDALCDEIFSWSGLPNIKRSSVGASDNVTKKTGSNVDIVVPESIIHRHHIQLGTPVNWDGPWTFEGSDVILVYSAPGHGKTTFYDGLPDTVKHCVVDTDYLSGKIPDHSIVLTNRPELIARNRGVSFAFMSPRLVWNHRVSKKCASIKPTWYDDARRACEIRSPRLMRFMSVNFLDADLRLRPPDFGATTSH